MGTLGPAETWAVSAMDEIEGGPADSEDPFRLSSELAIQELAVSAWVATDLGPWCKILPRSPLNDILAAEWSRNLS